MRRKKSGTDGVRTRDLRIDSPTCCQLHHDPKEKRARIPRVGFEPTIVGLEVQCLIHLATEVSERGGDGDRTHTSLKTSRFRDGVRRQPSDGSSEMNWSESGGIRTPDCPQRLLVYSQARHTYSQHTPQKAHADRRSWASCSTRMQFVGALDGSGGDRTHDPPLNRRSLLPLSYRTKAPDGTRTRDLCAENATAYRLPTGAT